jgi:hypothetical protein|tara:strand:- start:126 stop:233 length:108 start_codon:yes stop_codon:yes gene_type:complete
VKIVETILDDPVEDEEKEDPAFLIENDENKVEEVP